MLVGLTADEALELVEPRACGPAVGGAGRTDLPGCGFVVFPEGGGAVSVQAQHFGQWREHCWDEHRSARGTQWRSPRWIQSYSCGDCVRSTGLSGSVSKAR